jgi:hypothetical protein
MYKSELITYLHQLINPTEKERERKEEENN